MNYHCLVSSLVKIGIFQLIGYLGKEGHLENLKAQITTQQTTKITHYPIKARLIKVTEQCI